LIAPDSDDNSWHYKFTWNPLNVVTAGSDGARYLSNGKTIDVPYDKIFENAKKVKVENVGTFAWYPNRDSFRYLDLYDVPDIKNFLRATLRHPSFTKGWQALVLLGLTNKIDKLESTGLTVAGWVKQVTKCPAGFNLYKHVAHAIEVTEDDKVMHMLQWLGLFEDQPLPQGSYTCADLLLSILQDKWEMRPGDRDMVIMQHEFEYVHKGAKVKLNSAMTVFGDGKEYSAMSKTVGLPIGILARQILSNKITPPVGVQIPNTPAIYRPILTELAHYDITFQDFVA
jgi:saccharopine dehydrogenase-like NADP-dependent oxidoreductase